MFYINDTMAKAIFIAIAILGAVNLPGSAQAKPAPDPIADIITVRMGWEPMVATKVPSSKSKPVVAKPAVQVVKPMPVSLDALSAAERDARAAAKAAQAVAFAMTDW